MSTSAPARPSARAVRARVAVSALFCLNGAITANVVPRYPEIKQSLDLSNAQLGTAIAAGPVGALLVGLAASVLIRKWGSANSATVALVVMALNLVLIGIAPSWAVFALALFIAGSADAITDIAMNAHGLRVQRLYGRSIVNAFHGLWSVGAVVGGLMGALAAQLQVPLWLHLDAVMIVFVVATVLSRRFMLDGPENSERRVDHATAGRLGRRVIMLLILLGMVAAAGAVVEDSGASWGAIYLTGLGAIPVVAGLGFVALQGMQTIGRLLGDRVVTRIGQRATARLGGLLVIIGMGLALAFPHPATVVIGFGSAGLGIATLIPVAMHAADEIPGLPPGIGLTVVAWLARIGFLVSPPVIGTIADAVSLRAGLLVVPVAGVLVILSAVSLPARRRHRA